MELESAVKYFSPKGMSISDEPRATASDCLTGTDLMGAIGMCQSKASFGMAAFLAKTGVSTDDRERASAALVRYAYRTAPKLVVKAAGGQLGKCLVVLARLAFEEYCRSAASTCVCQHCAGRGYRVERRQVIVYPSYISPFDDEEKIPARYELQDVRENCSVCKGKGKLTARCRCNGTGRVRDLAESARQGVPVDRECERCSGVGAINACRRAGRTGLSPYCCLSCRSARGTETGSHFLKSWWQSVRLKKATLTLSSGK